jgi:hypothetical protein
MTTDTLFIYILLIHFLADFALQTHEQASKKSSDNLFLLYHVSTYTLVWIFACIPIFGFSLKIITFCEFTFLFHFLTDFITSRIGKSFWEKEDYHNGFVVVGFDQILHYVQIWFCIKWLL